MTDKVPSLSILLMILALAVSVALPVGLGIYYRKVKKADVLPFFIGCAIMVLFAFILEPIVHRVILNSETGKSIQGSVWLYGLYGGAMAGLFEETGRFAAFKTILRRNRENDANALMYGAGHGGLEALAVLGIASVNNILYSVLINSGNMSLLTSALTGETLEQVEGAVRTLITTPSWHFLMGSVERIFAVILQMSLSVLVWFAAKKRGRFILYPAAILLHAITDAATVVLSRSGASLPVVEAVVAVLAAVIALIARKVWKDNAVSSHLSEETEP